MTADASVRFRWIQAIAVVGIAVLAVILILPAIQQAQESARRTQSKNNLKQIWLALDNYHDTYLCLPSGGTFDSEGRGFHGWGIAFLPFFDSVPLFSQVDFNQPWNAPYNAGCFHIQFSGLINPSIGKPTDEGFAITHYSANSNLLAANSWVKLPDIPDRSQTFLAGELGGDFVPWGCPYNWRPLHGLTDTPRTYGRLENWGCHFVMADGHVQWISSKLSEELLVALRGINLAGNAAVDLQIQRPSSFPYPANARMPRPMSNHVTIQERGADGSDL